MTSTNGTLAMVFTSPLKPNATVNEKTPDATIEKKVQEDSDNTWGDSNTAQIGDTVNFQTTISAKKGAKNYVLHDQMEDGLTLNQNSIVVKVGETTLTQGTDYTVAFNTNDGCDFEITFTQTYLDTISGDTTIVVTYSAVLNGNAEIADATNDNKTQLTYGANSKTEWDTTTTKTYQFEVLKYDAKDNTKKPLAGATFQLKDASGNVVKLIKVSDTEYRIANGEEMGAVDSFTTVVSGKIVIKGVDLDKYTLTETQTPAGYNKLKEDTEVTVTAGETVTVEIANQSGVELPSTGGVGTTIFYVLGGVLVLAAIVLLVTKKRMNAEK